MAQEKPRYDKEMGPRFMRPQFKEERPSFKDYLQDFVGDYSSAQAAYQKEFGVNPESPLVYNNLR